MHDLYIWERSLGLRSGLRPAGSAADHLPHDSLCFYLDAAQMIEVATTLGVNLVNVFGAGRTRGKPSVLRNHLDAANGIAIARRGRQDFHDLFSGKLGSGDVCRSHFGEDSALLGGCRSVDALVN